MARMAMKRKVVEAIGDLIAIAQNVNSWPCNTAYKIIITRCAVSNEDIKDIKIAKKR